MAEVPVIAVDGPSGTGKGTLCARLADALHWHLLDSGALYRVTAYAAGKAGLALEPGPALDEIARNLKVDFKADSAGTGLAVYLDGEEISAQIRTERCGNAASRVAAYPGVRKALLQRQHAFKRPPGLIADGRDMGSVVFPEARLKIFLTASHEERAKRRYKQLKEQGFSVNLARLSAELAERDARDRERIDSPLKPAPGAYIIETTAVNIEQVGRQVLELVRRTFPETAGQLPINQDD
jgi:cytidylate kinase